MNGQAFKRAAMAYFEPFLTELGFSVTELEVSGRFYSAEFTGRGCLVSVTFEPGDEALFVMVREREGKLGRLSDIDDRVKTPRLSDLNRRFMPQLSERERVSNEASFEGVRAEDDTERLMLKAAKELRLVLPLYLRARPSSTGGV